MEVVNSIGSCLLLEYTNILSHFLGFLTVEHPVAKSAAYYGTRWRSYSRRGKLRLMSCHHEKDKILLSD